MISLEQLSRVLANSTDPHIDGQITINGMQYTLVKNETNETQGHNRSMSASFQLANLHRRGTENSLNRFNNMMEPISALMYAPPMNEQRSTDKPILESGFGTNNLHKSMHVMRPQKKDSGDQFGSMINKPNFYGSQ